MLFHRRRRGGYAAASLSGLLASELRVLILHGMVHLAGYDHENDNGEMVHLERRLRRRLAGACAETMSMMGYTLGRIGLCVVLAIFSFLDRVYQQLGRVATGTLREHSEMFESEIEPRLRLDRRRASLGFAILAHLSLAAVARSKQRAGVFLFVPTPYGRRWGFSSVVYVTVEVLFFACILFRRSLDGPHEHDCWLKPLVPALRAALIVTWPLRAALDLAISVGRISEEELPPGTQAQQDGIEALVEAAQEGGMLAGDKAQLIEQVVEFSDKRVLEVMTPRPDIVAIPANATIEQMRRLLVETKFSRLVVYQQTLDDVVGIAHVAGFACRFPESDGGSIARGPGIVQGRHCSFPRQSWVRICSRKCGGAISRWPSPLTNMGWWPEL